MSIFISDEFLCHYRVHSWVFSSDSFDFGVSVVSSENSRPLWPWIVRCALHRGLRHQLKINDRVATMTHRSTDAICSRVSSANNNNIFTGCVDPMVLLPPGLQCAILGHEQLLLVCCEKFHRKVNTLQVTPRYGQVTRLGGTKTHAQGIEVRLELVGVHVDTNISVGDEFNTLLSKQVDATIDSFLFQFHVGNTIHEEPTNTIGTLENCNFVAHLIQLISCSQT
mmetsp:Transcript_77559/g.224286  ORF Transcript_77559/g.224286 Transcript_77559/m.224286 type:complete len:224 (-) Transcript_77559:113-784(-)